MEELRSEFLTSKRGRRFLQSCKRRASTVTSCDCSMIDCSRRADQVFSSIMERTMLLLQKPSVQATRYRGWDPKSRSKGLLLGTTT